MFCPGGASFSTLHCRNPLPINEVLRGGWRVTPKSFLAYAPSATTRIGNFNMASHGLAQRISSTANSSLVRDAGRCFGSMAGRSFFRTYNRASSGMAIVPQAGWATSSPRTTKTWP
jgi:hypothetical protein